MIVKGARNKGNIESTVSSLIKDYWHADDKVNLYNDFIYFYYTTWGFFLFLKMMQ